MNIIIGADHRGFAHKEWIKQQCVIPSNPITWIDVGAHTLNVNDDYPCIAMQACTALRTGHADCGVLICGTGAGMAITANRYRGVYAALVWTEELARLAREHDNANVLVLPSDYITREQSVELVTAWLAVSFLAGRHQRRIDEIDALGGI